MEKRGINPLIASVFLIGFVFIIAAMIFAGMGRLTKDTLKGQEQVMMSAELIDFSVSLKGNCSEGDCYVLLIENMEEREIGFLVRTIGDRGVDVYSEDIILEPYEARLFEIDFDKDKVGNKEKVEVIPFSYG